MTPRAEKRFWRLMNLIGLAVGALIVFGGLYLLVQFVHWAWYAN